MLCGLQIPVPVSFSSKALQTDKQMQTDVVVHTTTYAAPTPREGGSAGRKLAQSTK